MSPAPQGAAEDLIAQAQEIMTQVRFRAGGVVLRCCPASGAQQVLLVSSRRCSGSFGFPAGKFEQGRDWDFEACALRETQEEAGAECEIVSDLGWYKGLAKKDAVETRTRFFAMRCGRELEQWPEATQRLRRWVDLAEAKKITKHTPMFEQLFASVEALVLLPVLGARACEALGAPSPCE